MSEVGGYRFTINFVFILIITLLQTDTSLHADSNGLHCVTEILVYWSPVASKSGQVFQVLRRELVDESSVREQFSEG